MTIGILYWPMLPSVRRKQSGTTRTISLNAPTPLHMTVEIVGWTVSWTSSPIQLSQKPCCLNLNPSSLFCFSVIYCQHSGNHHHLELFFVSLRSSHSSKWKILFHSIYGNFGNANRKFWSNGWPSRAWFLKSPELFGILRMAIHGVVMYTCIFWNHTLQEGCTSTI